MGGGKVVRVSVFNRGLSDFALAHSVSSSMLLSWTNIALSCRLLKSIPWTVSYCNFILLTAAHVNLKLFCLYTQRWSCATAETFRQAQPKQCSMSSWWLVRWLKNNRTLWFKRKGLQEAWECWRTKVQTLFSLCAEDGESVYLYYSCCVCVQANVFWYKKNELRMLHGERKIQVYFCCQ